jgi:hypothetical protein
VDARFYDALLTSPLIILGERLLPLSIGHHAILTALQSPFLCGGKPDLADCLILIGICSRKFSDAHPWTIRFLDDRSTAKHMAKILGRRAAGLPTTFADRLKFPFRNYCPDWKIRFTPLPLPALVKLLDDYVERSTRVMPLRKPPKVGVDHAPLHVRLVASLRLPETDAWDYPYLLAFWQFVCAEHSDSIITEAQAAQIARLKRLKERQDQQRQAAQALAHPRPSEATP